MARLLNTPGFCHDSIKRWGHALINKIADSAQRALSGLQDGTTVMAGGFGTTGIPDALIDALIAQGARDSLVVHHNAGNRDHGLAALLKTGRVRKIIGSFVRQANSHVFDALLRSGNIELELTPQGYLSGRIRAAGAGIGAFCTPTGCGTELAYGKETLSLLASTVYSGLFRSLPRLIWPIGTAVKPLPYPLWAVPWTWQWVPSKLG